MSGPVEYYCYDAVGHVTKLTDPLGAATQATRYNAFGLVEFSSGASTNNRLANTKERDGFANTELDNHGFRYYEPATGRYLTRDPIGYADGLNCYIYVGDNPINRVDPLGLADASTDLWYEYRRGGREISESIRSTLHGWGASLSHAGANSESFTLAVAGGGFGNLLEQAGTIGGGMSDLPGTYSDIQSAAANDAAANVAMGQGVFEATAGGMAKNTPVSSSGWGLVEMVTGQEEGGVNHGEKLSAMERTQRGLNFVRDAAAIWAAKLKLKQPPGGTSPEGCFVAGTLVLTEHGPVWINDIESGDRVWTMDVRSGEWELAEVLQPLTHDYAGDLVTITIGDVRIEATGTHPFWVEAGADLLARPAVTHAQSDVNYVSPTGGRWVEARHVRVGDAVFLRSGERVKVTHLSSRHVKTVVYNLQVDRLHCYAVSDLGVLVHNKAVRYSEFEQGMADRGPSLGQQQGRDFRTDSLEVYEFDPNQPSHVRGWLSNERRRIEQGKADAPRNPPGYVQAHGRSTPAREGYDYSNSKLQGEDLNKLEEKVRRQNEQ